MTPAAIGLALCVVAALAGVVGWVRGKAATMERLTYGTRFVLLDAWSGEVTHASPDPEALTSSTTVPRCDLRGWHEGAKCGLLTEVRVYAFGPVHTLKGE